MKNKLYEKLVNAFLRNIPEVSQLKFGKAYLLFLRKEYDKYFEQPLDESEFNKYANFCIDKEKVLHIDKSPTEKEAFLFPDSAYQKFESFSLAIFNMALEFIKTKNAISNERYDNLKNECLKLFADISDLFKYTAERLLSETLLDLDLIRGNSNNFSLRISNYID